MRLPHWVEAMEAENHIRREEYMPTTYVYEFWDIWAESSHPGS